MEINQNSLSMPRKTLYEPLHSQKMIKHETNIEDKITILSNLLQIKTNNRDIEQKHQIKELQDAISRSRQTLQQQELMKKEASETQRLRRTVKRHEQLQLGCH